MRQRWFAAGGLALALGSLLVACFAPKAERLTCDDVHAATGADFRDIQALVRDPEKGCLDTPCHSAETQRKGLRLDTPELVYDEMSSRPELFYAVLSSAEMPEEGTPWSAEDLELFRSWYCSGAFPP